MDLPLHRMRHSNPPPAQSKPATQPSFDFAELEQRILARLERRVKFLTIPFATTATPLVLRKTEVRYYLFIENADAAGTLIVNFDSVPDAAGLTGVSMGPGGFYEPTWVPDNEIQVIGSVVGVRGFAIIATQLAR